jgi:signal peptidase II
LERRASSAARSAAVPALVAAAVVGLDQAAKSWATRTLGPGAGLDQIELIGAAVRFVYVENRGAAFGILQGQGGVLALLALIVLAALVWYYIRTPLRGPWLAAGLGLIGGGAVGNLLDRVRLGFVVDFIAVGWWPRFNLADSAITLGVVCLALHALRDEPTPSPDRSGPPARERATSDPTAAGR